MGRALRSLAALALFVLHWGWLGSFGGQIVRFTGITLIACANGGYSPTANPQNR